MHNGKLVSLGAIIWKVMRNPLAADLSYEDAAEFAIEFIRLVGAPLSYIDEVCKIELNDFKARIPSNVINVRGIRYTGLNGCDSGVAMRYATDLYHNSELDETGSLCNMEFTYTLQNCVVIASVKKGFIEIAYTSIALDEAGYPLIPDNESYKKGLEYYILHKYLEPLWAMGKIQDKVFHYYSQERFFYTGQAEFALKLQGIDHLESVMNGLNRLIIQDQTYDNFYKNFGSKEYIKKYH